MDPKNKKYILISCAVVLVVACICVGIVVLSGVGVSLLFPFTSPSETISTPVSITAVPEETTQVPEATEPGMEETATIEFPTPESALPAELADTITQIEDQVMQIRGLPLTGSVNRTLISPTELEEIVTNDFFSEYTNEDARKDALILSLLGLLPPDFDLKSFYEDLYSEQISGFYDDELQQMYVVQGEGFGGSEKLTYAHEFTHVLQDQSFDFEEGLILTDEACEADSERCAAIQALIEGDASLSEILWFQSFATQQDYEDLIRTFNGLESPVLDSAPPFMAADLYFPYEYGLAFVETLYDQGGFKAIDDAFQNPPVSTEQILHPERYPDDLPIPVSLPNLEDVLGDGWSLFDQNVMGEWYIYLVLNKAYDDSEQISEGRAEGAAEGWGGDSYAFYLNDETNEVVFVMDVVWENSAEAEQFAAAFENYAGLRWGPADSIFGSAAWSGDEGSTVLVLDGERTIWVTAPDSEMLESILTTIQ